MEILCRIGGRDCQKYDRPEGRCLYEWPKCQYQIIPQGGQEKTKSPEKKDD